MKKSTLPAAAVLFCLLSFKTLSLNAQSLQVDPHRSWRILETSHFEIIYDETQKALAQNFANEAERAQSLLEPLLKPGKMKKVPVAIADVTDSANGAASPMPRSQIELYPVLPSVTDPIGEYYDWPRELITHEYTHILNFEPTSGVFDVLRSIFGSIVKPAGLLPHWYLEGLAVEMESRLTPVGRGRSHYYSALLRSFVEDEKWGSETIDRIGSPSIPTWPRGQRPYTYGFFLVHELSEMKNQSGVSDNIYGLLNERYGRRVPFFINGPPEDLFGADYANLLNKMYQRILERTTQELTAMKAVKKPIPSEQSGYFNFGAQISPDKLKLAAIVDDYDSKPSIKVWSRINPQEPFNLNSTPEAIIVEKDIHQLSWRADSRHIVFDHSDYWQHFNVYNDLYELDLINGHEERLTTGLRAREAAVLPDQSLVFIQTSSDRTTLMASSNKGASPQVLFKPGFGERLSSPRAYRDGVIYSHRDRKGHEWIEYLSLKIPAPTALTTASKIGQMHVMPVPDQISEGGFFFASSDTGVMNIYHSDGKNISAVTNTSTYNTSPEVDASSGSVIYSRMTSEGFKLDVQTDKEKIESPKNTEPVYNYPPADESVAPATTISDDRPYNGLKYLFPQYFIPYVYFVPGGSILSASTSNSDPLRRHVYAANVGYDTRVNKPTEELIYSNGNFPFSIDLAIANDYYYLVGANLTEHFTFVELDSRHFILPDSNNWIFGPQVTYRQTEYAPYLFVEFGPGATLSYTNIERKKDFQISPESGGAFNIGYDYFLANWGNTSYPNLNANASIYLSGKPLPKHHVISQKISASISPPQQTILTGNRQAGGEYAGSLFATNFLVRGYPVGEFVGSTIYSENFEYRFPIAQQYSGSGTFPLFVNKWHGALLFDAATLEGGYYNSNFSPAPLYVSKLGWIYAGTGAELRADVELFYNIPLTLRMGAYYGFNQAAFGGVSYYLGFGLIQ
jgi:hypothetical protein